MAGEGELAKAGLALVVENLNKFQKDVGQATQSLRVLKSSLGLIQKGFAAITPHTTLLEKGLKSLGDVVKNFANNVVNVAVIALGVLLRDAIRKVIDIIGELIGTIIDASNEFQRLKVRLNTFNMQPMIESGMSFNDAMEKSIALTKEQLMWVIKLAKTTPYDATDIANAYSLARSYGFLDAKAKSLTDAIMDFASGMALDKTAIEKIITNLGQMVQQGKITGTELRDLARGAFVPVNKVLELIAKNLGITTEALNKMRKEGTAKPEWFIDAFIELVNRDFAGASERMSRTFKSAVDNMKDTFLGLGAMMIGSPVFDILGGKIADLVEAFNDIRYNKLTLAFARIGESISRIINRLFNLLPSTGSIADKIIEVFNKIGHWIGQHEDDIVNFIRGTIEVLGKLWNTLVTEIIPAIANVIGWIIKNKDEIWKWIKVIAEAWLKWELFVIGIRVVLIAISTLIGAIIKAITAIIAFKTAVALVKGILYHFGVDLTVLSSSMAALGISTGGAAGKLTIFNAATAGTILKLGGIVTAIVTAGLWWAWFGQKMSEIGRQIFSGTAWGDIGENIINGILSGASKAAPKLIAFFVNIANFIISIFNSIFGIKSPSKVMFATGTQMMTGLAQGIAAGAKAVYAITGGVAAQINGIMNGNKGGGTGAIVTPPPTNGEYLNQGGEVMRSKMVVEPPKDPCAKDGAAKCIADTLKDGLGGVGGALDDMLASFTDLVDFTKGVIFGFGEEAKGVNDAYKKDLEDTRFGFSADTMRLVDGTLISIETTRRDTLEAIKDEGIVISDTAREKLTVATQQFVTTTREMGTNFSATMADFMSKLFAWISGQKWGNNEKKQKDDDAIYNDKGVSYNSNKYSNNTSIVNNFGSLPTGKRITWDYENSQFWV